MQISIFTDMCFRLKEHQLILIPRKHHFLKYNYCKHEPYPPLPFPRNKLERILMLVREHQLRKHQHREHKQRKTYKRDRQSKKR